MNCDQAPFSKAMLKFSLIAGYSKDLAAGLLQRRIQYIFDIHNVSARLNYLFSGSIEVEMLTKQETD